MNKTWWKEAVVYQIYPRSFQDSNGDGIGDLQGIISRLDYLKDLGVDVLWISPVFVSPQVDNGYDIADYQAIMSDFGTMEDFDELLAQSHQRGLKIILDMVLNHTSDQHPWFIASRSSKDNPYRKFYFWRDQPNNWGSWFDGSAWAYDEMTDMYYLHVFAKEQPDLNWDYEPVRDALYEMMKWWLDKGVDGFRMDVINLISKVQTLPDGEVKEGKTYASLNPYCRFGPRLHEFLQEMNHKVLSHYDVMNVGEMPGVTVDLARDFVDEKREELQMVFHFEHMGIDGGPNGKWTDKKFRLIDLKNVLFRWQEQLTGDCWNALYWNNHDQPRVVSRFGNDDPKWREKSAKMLALCLHMLKGTPYVYQGEELGMTNASFTKLEDYQDVETYNAYRALVETDHKLTHEEMMAALHAKSRDNARTPIQWDDTPHAGFTTGTPWLKVNDNYKTINAQAQVNDGRSVFAFYRRLNHLRKQMPLIVYGECEAIMRDDPAIFAYKRYDDKKTLYIYCNFTDTIQKYQPVEGGTVLLNNDESFTPGVLTPYQAVAILYDCVK